jgi:hypothetical protein
MRIIAIISILLLLCSCATEKSAVRYITKHPEILEEFVDTTRRVEVRNSIVYRDTTITVVLPGDTVFNDTTINVVGLISGSVEARNEFAATRAWVRGDQLMVRLELNERALRFAFDSIATASVRTEIVYETQWLPSEPYIPKSHHFFKYSFYTAMGLLLFILILLIRALRKIGR